MNPVKKLSGNGSSVQDLYDINTIDTLSISMNLNMATERLGNGMITFLDISSLSYTSHNHTTYKQHLSNVLNYMSSYLPRPNLPNSPMYLPYPPDLFKYVIPEFISLWYLKGLHGYGLSNQGATTDGQLTVRSSNLYITCKEISAEKLVISSNTTTNTFQEIKLEDVRIIGDGTIFSKSSGIVLGRSLSGSLINLHVKPNEYSELHLTNVKGEISIEKDNISERVALSGENLTILTTNEYTILAEQPTITVNGFLNGKLLITFSYGNKFFCTKSRGYVTFEGNFVFEILYDSGQVLIRMLDTMEIQEVYWEGEE